MLDPALGRWFVVDPAIENNHYEWSPYVYVYNDPIRLIDPFGLDSLQRAQAIEASNKDVNAKEGDNPEEYDKSDCSSTLNRWTSAGGESYLKAPWANGSGASTIEANVEKASKSNPVLGKIDDENDIVPGVGYVWKKIKDNGSVSYHAGLVVGVERDESGNITQIRMNHSEDDRGFIQDKFDPNDKSSRWVKRKHSYFRWDSKPDTYKANIPAVTVNGQGSSYLQPKPRKIKTP